MSALSPAQRRAARRRHALAEAGLVDDPRGRPRLRETPPQRRAPIEMPLGELLTVPVNRDWLRRDPAPRRVDWGARISGGFLVVIVLYLLVVVAPQIPNIGRALAEERPAVTAR